MIRKNTQWSRRRRSRQEDFPSRSLGVPTLRDHLKSGDIHTSLLFHETNNKQSKVPNSKITNYSYLLVVLIHKTKSFQQTRITIQRGHEELLQHF